MNQVTGNIFDMLLGFDPVAVTGSQPTLGITAEGGQAFDAILLSLLGNGTVVKATGDLMNTPMFVSQGNNGIDLPVDGSASNNKVIETMLQKHVLGGGNNQSVDLIAAEITTDGMPQKVAEVGNEVKAASIVLKQDDTDLSTDVRQFLNLPNRHVASLTQVQQPQSPVAMFDNELALDNGGIYKVVKAQVEGEAVRLELTTSSDPHSGRIQITIPKDQLTNMMSTQTQVSDKRIPISGMPAPVEHQQSIDGLLQKLNLVELKIVDPQVTSAPTAKVVEFAATINTTPEKAAVPMLTLTIDRRLIVTEQQAKTGGQSEIVDEFGEPGVSKSEDGLLLKQVRPSMAGMSGREVPTLAERMQFAAKDGLDRLLSNGQKTEQVTTTGEQRELVNFDLISGRRLTLDSSMPTLDRPAQVRFTLPDNLQSTLRPNGEAVMLKIQPDHLGPARLLLEIKNGMLHARVTVETIAARDAVEGSLDRLVDQLQKQDIKVDHIQVTLQNENGRHQFFDRRSQYPHMKNGLNGNNRDESEEVLASGVGVNDAHRAPVYMSAQGLNLYA